MTSPPRDAVRSPVGNFSATAEVRDLDIRVLAAAAVRHEGKVLVIREEDEPFGKTWVLPQGYPRTGESLPAAAAREAREETGLDVEVEGFLGLYEDFEPAPSGDRVHWVIACYLAFPVPGSALRSSREAVDFAWIDPGKSSQQSPAVVQRMLSDLARRPDPRGPKGNRRERTRDPRP